MEMVPRILEECGGEARGLIGMKLQCNLCIHSSLLRLEFHKVHRKLSHQSLECTRDLDLVKRMHGNIQFMALMSASFCMLAMILHANKDK